MLSAEGGRNKWHLLASLESLGWQGLTGTDVNSVLYEPDRGFIHDDGTPPSWWGSELQCTRDSASVNRDRLPAGALGGDSYGLELYEGSPPRAWQTEAVAAWRAANHRGVVEAVTGTGKTVVGTLAAAEAVADGGRVAVIVPGLDLLDQWYERLRHDLPTVSVGRMGDGHEDSLIDHDVLVVTVQSACRWMIMPSGGRGLLIADEVHHYGAEQYSQALEPEFVARLGLTATYEREDRGIEHHLAPYFARNEDQAKPGSEVVMRCGYERGLADDILARFRVALVGVDFTAEEKDEHDAWDENARHLRGQLISQHGCPQEPFGEFMRAVSRFGEGGHPDGVATRRARQYLNAFSKRRGLLADCHRKLEAFDKLAPVLAVAERALVFTETKESAVRAAQRLGGAGVPADAYTSDLRRSARKDTLSEFGRGSAGPVRTEGTGRRRGRS